MRDETAGYKIAATLVDIAIAQDEGSVMFAENMLKPTNPLKPDTEAMKAAWDDFKTTKLFSALLAHMSPALMLENEGLLWGIFYNGYIAGAKTNG